MLFESMLDKQDLGTPGGHGLHQGPYITRGEKVHEPADAHADPEKHKKPSSAAALVGEAVLWPMFVSQRDFQAPAVVFGVSAFLAIPFLYPFTTVGASVLTSYGIAALTYGVEVFGKAPMSQLKGNPA